jgi:hypothetical protein
VPAARAAVERHQRIGGVPGPQRAKRLAAHLGGFIVERIPEQVIGPRGDRAAGRTDAHQDLQCANADVLLAGAQRGLDQLELALGSTRGGRARQRVECEAADLGIGIIE